VPQRADDRPLEGAPLASAHILPDLLAPGLRVVFCGTAAGEQSARLRAPYAGPGNRFWWVLHEVGLTPRMLRPAEFRELLGFGVGLTDVAKHAVGRDDVLVRDDFDAAAVIGKVERFRPQVLAFVGKRAAREVLGRNPGGYGEQDVALGVSRVWVMPSTSGAARGFWDVAPWQALAQTLSPHVHPSDVTGQSSVAPS
jgi:TDG/mug DNA glycosylase family protein